MKKRMKAYIFKKRGFTPTPIYDNNRKIKLVWGFTLIELMLAAVVLIVALGGLLHLFNYCLNLSTQAANIITATAEAYTKLEEIRLHNYNDIVAYYTDPDNAAFILQQLTGTGAVTASYEEAGTNERLLQATVTVNYTEKGNRVMSLTLTTLIARRF